MNAINSNEQMIQKINEVLQNKKDAIVNIIKVIVKSVVIYRKAPTGNLVKSFIKVHFPLIISVIILILMMKRRLVNL